MVKVFEMCGYVTLINMQQLTCFTKALVIFAASALVHFFLFFHSGDAMSLACVMELLYFAAVFITFMESQPQAFVYTLGMHREKPDVPPITMGTDNQVDLHR